jgi:multidrug efflux pump subunit AcrA (membrane-fusion protein)
VERDQASRTLALTEVNTGILEAARASVSQEPDWEFLCECGRPDCHEHVTLTPDKYTALRESGRPVLARGHRLSQVERARRLQADAEALRRQAQHQLRRAQSGQRDRRMTALTKANEIRIARARLKQQLREGDARIEQILAAPPECASTAAVLDLLLTVPNIGPVRAGRLLTSAGVKPTKTIGTLSERQRTQLIDLLRGRTGL